MHRYWPTNERTLFLLTHINHETCLLIQITPKPRQKEKNTSWQSFYCTHSNLCAAVVGSVQIWHMKINYRSKTISQTLSSLAKNPSSAYEYFSHFLPSFPSLVALDHQSSPVFFLRKLVIYFEASAIICDSF